MDPKVWGSKLWNILFDVCWMVDERGDRLNDKSKKACRQFFYLLRYLLPCIYCRQSYGVFHDYLGGLPVTGRRALRWIYNLKNLVNRKLGVPGISYDCFERRMKTWSGASSTKDVWDMLSLFAMNYSASSADLTRNEKKAHLSNFIEVFSCILQEMPGEKKYQGRSLHMSPPTSVDLKCGSTLMKYVCKKANECPKDATRRLQNCRAKKDNKTRK